MSIKEIHELYYSNGMDVFGPVSADEFSRNRYYKHTLIWYDGLDAWIKISDSAEFKHLIGSLNSKYVDVAVPESLSTSTPPLSKIRKPIAKSRKFPLILFPIVLILLLLAAWFVRTDSAPAAVYGLSDSTVIMQIASIAGEEARKETYKNNWQKFVLAVPNSYKRKLLGGIEELSVKIRNNCPYTIDSVTVEVSYIRSNGDVFQKEILEFDNLAAQSEKELYAPDSRKGYNVVCNILSVNSRELDLNEGQQ